MCPGAWTSPCMLLGFWLSLWELWRVHISWHSWASQRAAMPGSCLHVQLGLSNSVRVWCACMSQVGLVTTWPFFSVFAPFLSPTFPLDRNNPGLKFWGGWVTLCLNLGACWWGGGLSIYWRCSLLVSSPHCLAFHLMPSPLSPGSLSYPWCLGLFRGSPCTLTPNTAYFN